MTDEIEHDKPDAITRLRAENERLGRDYQTARNAHDKLVLKNERLRAALEELLWYTNQLELAVYDPAEWPSTHGAVRAARAALEEGRT